MKQILSARLVVLGILLVILIMGPARPAMAQSPAWSERIWFSVSGGVQPTVNSFSDGFEVPLNTETETVTIAYPVKGGAVIAASGGYRVWKRLALGFGVTRYNRRADATVDAQLPHPFFDNQFRAVQGTTAATRNEVGAHVLIGWMMPITDHLRLLVTAGPSVLSVRQSLVTSVEVTETYPYDTAAFKSAATKDATATATGFNAGADVFWMFSRHVGAGGLIQITRARVKAPTDGGRTVSIDAGGVQAGGGLRFIF
jgi:hypothetical protein